MNVTLRTPTMTREQFLDWVERQGARHEFDGFEPVAMNGSSVDHDQICQNIYFALRTRLRGSPCRVLGPTTGLATSGHAVRYPDALVVCGPLTGRERLVQEAVVVLEVVSANSARSDRVFKLREYAAIPSLRRYVVLESETMALAVFSRPSAVEGWTAGVLLAGETLAIPEIDLGIPVDELYEDVRFDPS